MLWIEPCSMIYAGVLGGFFGGCITSIMNRKTQREYVSRVEELWNADIKTLRSQIIELSTKKVDKVVHKHKKDNWHKQHRYPRPFEQRG